MIRLSSCILAVDQATESGWSIHLGRRPLASGAINVWDFRAREAVVREAYALSAGRPFLFTYEDHAQRPLRYHKSTATLIALGGALWLWFDTLIRVGHPEDMRLGITSRDWRRRVLGLSEAVGRDALKAEAVRWAEAYAGKAMGHDEADATALGAYASVYGESELLRRAATAARRTRRARGVRRKAS